MMRRFGFEINMVACWVESKEFQTIRYPGKRVPLRTESAKGRETESVTSSSHWTKPIQATSTASIPTSYLDDVDHRLRQRLGLTERSIDDLQVEKAVTVTLGFGSSGEVGDDWAG